MSDHVIKAPVEVEVDGRTWRLWLDTAACRRFEARSKRSLLSIGADMDVTTLAELLLAALGPHQPGARIEDVDRIIDTVGFDGAADLVERVIAASPPFPTGPSNGTSSWPESSPATSVP